MKVQMIITHVNTGTQYFGDVVEASQQVYEDSLNLIKRMVSDTEYFEVGGTILPGEFVRRYCVISFNKTGE